MDSKARESYIALLKHQLTRGMEAQTTRMERNQQLRNRIAVLERNKPEPPL